MILRAARKDDRPEFWDIPKGELEKGESGIEAAKREVKEETGIENFKFIEDFKFTARYFIKREEKTIPKFVAVFLAEAKNEKIKLSFEHDIYEWASLDEALKKLSTMKKALISADEFLKKSS